MNKTFLAWSLALIVGMWFIFGFVVMDWDVTGWHPVGRFVYVCFCIGGMISLSGYIYLNKPLEDI
jgi:hypothetical protein